MKVNRYNPVNMNLISEDVTSIDFGNVNKGTFCKEPIVVKLVADEEIFTDLAFYLENRGGLNHTRFGLYKSSFPVTGILSNDSRINIFLREAPGVSDNIQYSDRKVSLDINNPEYIWLNVFVGDTETNVGIQDINYRFVFEYY